MRVCSCCAYCFCFQYTSQEIGWKKRLRNDLFWVEWDVKSQLKHTLYRPVPFDTVHTRKRDKAQHVTRPACANATVHFYLPTYRLYMLPSKTSAVRIFAYVHLSTFCKHVQRKIAEVTGPKFTKFLRDVDSSISWG